MNPAKEPSINVQPQTQGADLQGTDPLTASVDGDGTAKGRRRGSRSIRKWSLLGILALAVVAFFYFDLTRHISLASLKENREALRAFTQSHYLTTVFLFILVYLLQTTFSLPGAAILTLAGGYLFGTLLGTFYVNIGATSGATMAFLAARYLFRDGVENRFGPRLRAIQQGFAENGFHYLLTLRLIPLFPFFLVNLASGLTRVPLSTYVLATAVGILPGSFVYSNAGKQLGTIETVGDVASPQVLVAFSLLGILALVPVLYQKFRQRLSRRTDP